MVPSNIVCRHTHYVLPAILGLSPLKSNGLPECLPGNLKLVI